MSITPPADDDQRLLVMRAQAGDLDAFNELVSRYQRVAYSVALRLLGDADQAADATQDAILAAYRGLAGLRGGAFRTWLLRIVTNQCLDVLRARSRRPVMSLDAMSAPCDDDTPALMLAASDGDPVAAAEQHELHALLRRGLLVLPEDQRVAVVLSDIEGFRYDEIAAITGANLGTIKARRARGRARLRDWLSHHVELLPRDYRHTPRDESPTGGGPDQPHPIK